MLKPFYSRQCQDFVVGEMCKCGHARTEHGSINTTVDDHIIRVGQEGNCCEGHCPCSRFTWQRWITETELCLEASKQVLTKIAS